MLRYLPLIVGLLCGTVSAQPAPPTKSDPAKPDPAKKPAPPVDPVADSLAKATPLATKKQLEDWEKEMKKAEYKFAVLVGDMQPAKKKAIETAIKYHLYRLTLNTKEDLKKIRERRAELMADLRTAAANLGGRPNAAENFRKWLYGKVVEHAKLPMQNHFYARMAVVTLLAEMKLLNGQGKLVPFPPAGKLLLEVLNSNSQPWKVKVHAARGLGWVLQTARLAPQLRTGIVEGLIKELKDHKTHYWYQMRLAEALTHDIIVIRGGKPTIVLALLDALKDKRRHIFARASMAKSLGRVKMNQASVDGKILALEIVDLGKQMVEYQRANPKKPYWKHAFLNLYLAFKREGADKTITYAGLLEKVGKELKAGDSAEIKAAYKLAVQPLQFIIANAGKSEKLPEAHAKKMHDWVAARRPNGARVAPMGPKVIAKPE